MTLTVSFIFFTVLFFLIRCYSFEYAIKVFSYKLTTNSDRSLFNELKVVGINLIFLANLAWSLTNTQRTPFMKCCWQCLLFLFLAALCTYPFIVCLSPAQPDGKHCVRHGVHNQGLVNLLKKQINWQ